MSYTLPYSTKHKTKIELISTSLRLVVLSLTEFKDKNREVDS